MSITLSELARKAGIVGAGGAGFPTHVKLNAKVHTLIINGAECEPLITVDQMLMLNYTEQLVQTAERLRGELNAECTIFAVKAKHHEVVAALGKAAAKYVRIKLHPMGDFYPAGDEVVTVYETTGLSVPQGGIPLDVSVVVINVETLWNLSLAEQNVNNTHKWLTVAGLVDRPGIYRVPLGITKKEVLQVAGARTGGVRIVDGGPMMGKLTLPEEPVVKTTKSLLVLPENHVVVINALRDISIMIRQAQSMCCQCRLCTDVCPRNLLGYNCEPHRAILGASYSFRSNLGGIIQATACSECGACDIFTCPMGLSPRRINAMLKQEIGRHKITDPKKGMTPEPSFWRTYRKIPTISLKQRLGVNKFQSTVIVHEDVFRPNCVFLQLKQHIGVPARPTVVKGDTVREGQLVAEIPEDAEVSCNIHGSIAGTVAAADDNGILIVR